MLAVHPARERNHFSDRTSSPSSVNTHLASFHGLPFSTPSPASSDFGGRLPFEAYPNLTVSPVLTSPASSATSQHMSGSYNLQPSPVIRVQGATPNPAYPLNAAGYPVQQGAPVDGADYPSLWNSFSGGNPDARMVATGTPALQNIPAPKANRRNRSHQRATSVSSIGTSGSDSPFSRGQATSNPYGSESSPSMNVAAKVNQSYGVDGSRIFSNHLPTPTHTPTQDSFLQSSFTPYNHNQSQNIDDAASASMPMNPANMEQATGEDEMPGMSHSGRHSVSSIGQEPSTPHTVVGDGFDDGFKVPSHDNIVHRSGGPKLERTMSDIYQDELYNPATAAAQVPMPVPKPMQNSAYLSPFRAKVSDALQAAQIARSQSPASQASRGVSPFRPDSPYVRDVVDRRIPAAAQPQMSTRIPMDMSQQASSQQQQSASRPTTISPKDAVLDYRPDEDDAMTDVSLFPESAQGGYGHQYGQQKFAGVGQGQFAGQEQNFGGFATGGSRAGGWPDASRAHPAPFVPAPPIPQQQQQQHYSYATPTSSTFAAPSLPFEPQNYQATSNMSKPHEETPDFPAHLASMESSASEAPPSSNTSNFKSDQQPQPSSNNLSNINGAHRPQGHAALADTGTYTCTYHGCSLRFETPQKLQKHKREGHRQATAQQQHTPGVGSGMTSAALASRNSQSGPHKCDRINPTTGKPCNTVFSRPYDLTRHEDTIHNIRKQKVRCALCVEEKTFSRNDALTRHMRVVHPDVDFPGKHRRRGAHD